MGKSLKEEKRESMKKEWTSKKQEGKTELEVK